MFDKIADIVSKLSPTIWLAVLLGIVVIAFVVCLVLSLGGDLAKFKKAAKKALVSPSFELFQATARELPTRARKQYKLARKTGEKPSDVITVDACVYSPYQSSMAARMPHVITAVGVFAALLSYFTIPFAKNIAESPSAIYLAPAVVTLGALLIRIIAGAVSYAILGSGVKVYDRYVAKLDECMQHGASEPVHDADIPFVRPDEPVSEPITTAEPYDPTFGEPDRIEFEAVEEETPIYSEPVVEQAPVVEEDPREKARAMAAQAAAAQAARQAAAKAKQEEQRAAAQATARAAAERAAARQAQAAQDVNSGSADEVIARIEQINREGAPLATMKEVALQLQKERAKPENKTPEQQRRLNEALASLLKAMSAANRK